MATIRSFEEIEAWRLARELAGDIYDLTSGGNFSKDYSLKDQINRSTGSIMDNIAEGFERGGNREFIHFLSIAKGSCAEVRSQLYRGFDRKYFDLEKLNPLKDKSTLISKKINGLINYLGSSGMKGMKFHESPETYEPEHRTQNSEHEPKPQTLN
jgi:four helix bundle protein